MKSSRSLIPVVLVSTVLGAGVAVGAVALFGLGGGSTTTVVRQTAVADGTPASNPTSSSLTPAQLYKRDAPGVAFITAEIVQTTNSFFGFPQQQQGTSTGSGFVIDKNGTILTNAHVVDGARKITVRFGSDKALPAKLVGADRSTDLAVLKVDPSGLNLHALPLGSYKDVQVGDPVIAIGNPFGLDRTLTTGVVSAKQRQIQGLNGFSIDNVIQTDAAINPGNSGGPLLDAAGRVIGINSQIETGGNGRGNVGIGFAIPVDTAKKIIPQLEHRGSVQAGYLGLDALTIDSSLSALNLPVGHGALVQQVTPGSPAAKAGIQGGDVQAQLNGSSIVLGGDIITAVDGVPVHSSDQLSRTIGARKPGSTVKLTTLRGGKKKDVEVTLGNRPQQTTQDSQQSVPQP
jgi:S1-C subfamily serine protease